MLAKGWYVEKQRKSQQMPGCAKKVVTIQPNRLNCHFWVHGGLGLFLGGVFGFDEGVGALDEGVDFGVGDVAVEVELYPVSKALIERVAHR